MESHHNLYVFQLKNRGQLYRDSAGRFFVQYYCQFSLWKSKESDSFVYIFSYH